jgi:N-acetylmuramoyl-L-alanine amidase
MRDINYIVLHCTGGPANQTLASIERYWKQELKWNNPGYHKLYHTNGTTYNLQPFEKISNGVGGFNKHALHFSYIGGVNSKGEIEDTRTYEQKLSMERDVRDAHKQFPNATILGHRDFSPDKNRNGIIEPHEWIKACPSFSVREWLKEIGLIKKPIIPAVKKLVSTASGVGVNVRSGPGTSYPIAGKISDGTAVIIVKAHNDWSEVIINDKCKGFILSVFLK